MDYKSISLTLSRVVYFFASYIGVSYVAAVEDGSLLHPVADWSRSDSAFAIVICAVITYLLFRFALKVEGSRRKTDFIILGISVLFGLLDWFS